MALTSTVHIETAYLNGRSVLRKSFCTPPFKIADVTEDRRQPELQLMLMSSSPGVLDKDNYSFHINLGTASKLRLKTQSYQRIFQMKIGASQNTEVRMAARSSLTYLPHPIVPHGDAIFKSTNKIFLGDDCSLLWGEVISCGRKMNDEIFKFKSYHSITEIFQGERLVVKENLLLQPGTLNLDAIGQLEGYTHQATLVFVNERAAINQLIPELAAELIREEGVAFGVTALPVNGILVRMLGYKAEQLFSLLEQLSTLVSFQSLQKVDAYV